MLRRIENISIMLASAVTLSGPDSWTAATRVSRDRQRLAGRRIDPEALALRDRLRVNRRNVKRAIFYAGPGVRAENWFERTGLAREQDGSLRPVGEAPSCQRQVKTDPLAAGWVLVNVAT
jgi:hypothetical protein